MIEAKSEQKQNLVTYFIMPMLQLNKSSFGADNFINSYLDKDGYLIVNTKDEIQVNNTIYNHENYITDYTKDDKSVMYVFSIPKDYIPDMELFIEGKYSIISAKAKIEIARTQSSDSFIVKMLNPQLEDREKIAHDLHVSVNMIKEIKSAPSENNYIKIK